MLNGPTVLLFVAIVCSLVSCVAGIVYLHRYITHTRVLDRLNRLATLDSLSAHYTREEKQTILNRCRTLGRLRA